MKTVRSTRVIDAAERDAVQDPPVIVSLDRVTAGWGAHPRLEDVSWQLREGELWAIVGPNGAGKSSLLAVLRGQIPITRGELRYGEHARGRAIAADPVGQVVSVSFEAQSPLLKGAAGYTQSRWHAGQDNAVARGRDVLGRGLNLPEVVRIVEALKLSPLLDRRLTELSNGERRKLLLARSAARRPAILAMDNPFNALDGLARVAMSAALGVLRREGMTVLVTSAREDEIPGAVTHLLVLDRGRIVTSGPKGTVIADERFAPLMRRSHSASVTVPSRREGAETVPVVELRGADLTYGGVSVLGGVSWTVRRGERWVVVGPNGAGKSALLSLILADNPQAYANDVSVFGRRRGSGDTIWEIRRRIGSVSPEAHLYEELDRRVVDVIGSGSRDPADPWRPSSAEERTAAEAWAVALDLGSCRDRPLRELSEGERQMALLGRALAKDPELLVLDEPCQGLDVRRRALFVEILERKLHTSDATLIYVTHDLDEVPSVVRRGLLLREGRSAMEGPVDEVLEAYAAT